MADLGFRGLHYIDVITIVQPPRCFDPNHPCTPKESAMWFDRILAACKDHIGGVSSEGGFDYACGNLDYALVYFGGLSGKHNAMHDRLIPNLAACLQRHHPQQPFTETVNAPAKDLFTQTKLVEFNGRPTFYIYSKFKSDNKNWMGEIDLVRHRRGTQADGAFVKKGYDKI